METDYSFNIPYRVKPAELLYSRVSPRLGKNKIITVKNWPWQITPGDFLVYYVTTDRSLVEFDLQFSANELDEIEREERASAHAKLGKDGNVIYLFRTQFHNKALMLQESSNWTLWDLGETFYPTHSIQRIRDTAWGYQNFYYNLEQIYNDFQNADAGGRSNILNTKFLQAMTHCFQSEGFLTYDRLKQDMLEFFSRFPNTSHEVSNLCSTLETTVREGRDRSIIEDHARLVAAVYEEDYELAAKLRDRIKEGLDSKLI